MSAVPAQLLPTYITLRGAAVAVVAARLTGAASAVRTTTTAEAAASRVQTVRVRRRRMGLLVRGCLPNDPPHVRVTWAGAQPFCRMSRISCAVSDGVLPTLTPTASSASFLACAVPEEPEMMAPAWPIVLPSGAVNPAT